MSQLTHQDLHFVVSRLSKDVIAAVKTHQLIIAGGYIRETIAGGKISDIDIFGSTVEKLNAVATELKLSRQGVIYKTDNALTLLSPPRFPLQFIKRWLFSDPTVCIASFDFTVCQAAIWFDGNNWQSVISPAFYSDLAARRLVYTYPHRDEDAGGSMLRMRKFIQRGYNIQSESMAGVICRLVGKLDLSRLKDEKFTAKVLTGLLREVDPLTVVDGIELVDEHELVI